MSRALDRQKQREAAAAEAAVSGHRASREGSFAGVGESKVFGGGGDPDRTLTVNGEPIPDHLRHAIPFANTDQGREEANSRKLAAAGGVRVATVEVRDLIDRLAAGDEGENDPWESVDPVKPLIDQYVPRGFRGKLLSPRKVDKEGTRGFVVVTDNGEPVKLGNMILGVMTEERANKRDKHYRDLSALAVKEAREAAQENMRAIAHESGGALAYVDTDPAEPFVPPSDHRAQSVEYVDPQERRTGVLDPDA